MLGQFVLQRLKIPPAAPMRYRRASPRSAHSQARERPPDAELGAAVPTAEAGSRSPVAPWLGNALI